jgi:hypothetical protein
MADDQPAAGRPAGDRPADHESADHESADHESADDEIVHGEFEEPEDAVDVFLDAVKREQHAYLDALRSASELIKQTPGRLPAVAASQLRLTQQWFDALRVFLFRQAVIDEETTRTQELAMRDAAAILAAAHARVSLEAAGVEMSEAPASELDVLGWPAGGNGPMAAPSIRPGGSPESIEVLRAEVLAPDDRARHGFLRRTPRQKLAEFCVAAVRTTEEAAALTAVIEETFRDDEHDLLRQRDELRGLLDSWWRSTNAAALTSVEDAHAGASIIRHFAVIEAEEVLERAGIDPRRRRLRPVLPATASQEVPLAELPAARTDASREGGAPEPHGDLDAASGGSPALPERMRAVLERAAADGATDVDAVLVELSDSLSASERDTDGALTPLVGDLVIRPEVLHEVEREWPLPDVSAIRLPERPRSPQVGAQVAAPLAVPAIEASPQQRRRWIPWEIVAPMVAMVAALTAVMAWIG